ncbi:MAG: dihydroorotase [Parcubacteria group bacterium]
MRTRIINATLADGQKTSIDIVDGKIAGLGISGATDKTLDIGGKYVLPGVIDAHVHFREPGGEHKEDWTTGSRAAAAGGVTTVLDMPNTTPPTIDAGTLEQKRLLAAKSIVNYGFHLGATVGNAEEIVKLRGSVAGVKIYVGSSTGSLLVSEDHQLRKLFTIPDVLWLVHAEDETLIRKNMGALHTVTDPGVHSWIRNREVAIRAVKRVIALARETKAHIHICHISTKEEVVLIQHAKAGGIPITCEVSPHHLFLDESAYATHSAFVKVNPPLRTPEDRLALWRGLHSGDIDIVATDHAPHTVQEKRQPYPQAPSGMPEVQTSLPLMLQVVERSDFTLGWLVDIMCTRPAELFSLTHKGRIEEGFDADLVVVDMNKRAVVTKEMLLSKCGWSPYEGKELIGWPVATFVNGNLVFDNGKINEENKGKEITYE